jgi:RNA polymerase sigma-70 factor (ECF subfamily)
MAHEGQAAVLRAMHDEHGPALWAFVLRLANGDRNRAEDVVQETMVRAWRHPEVLERSPDAVRAWLYTVARRIVIDESRRPAARREIPAAALPDRPGDDGADALLDSWLVAEALTRLSTEHRAVIVECYYRGRSTKDAAEVLGIPDGTVKSRTHYALRALRLALQELGVSR